MEGCRSPSRRSRIAASEGGRELAGSADGQPDGASMRRLAALLFVLIEIAEVHGQSASSTLKGLDECFAQTRNAEASCDQAGGDNAARLGCRLKAHSAEK